MGWTPGTESWPKMIDMPIEQWPSVRKEVNPNQMQIEFFWPLTEQIPLDFDYTRTWEYEKEKNKSTIASCDVRSGQVLTLNGATGTTWVTATFQGPVETPELVMKLDKQPNIVVRWLYKLLKIKWKV